MKRLTLLLLCAALILSVSACQKQASSVGVVGGSGNIVAGEAQLPTSPSSQDDDAPAPEGDNVDGGDKESEGPKAVPASEYDAYLKKYVVPYGNLKFYDEDWTNASDLGPDRVFEFVLQKNFNVYNSALDYTEVFGDEFTTLQVPEKWFDESYGLVYPQDIIENAAIEYFGMDKDVLRTAKSYIPTKSGYAAPMQDGLASLSSTAELLPKVKSVTRTGKRAELTVTLSPCDPLGSLIEGDVLTRVMVVEDKEETFRYVSVKSA